LPEGHLGEKVIFLHQRRGRKLESGVKTNSKSGGMPLQKKVKWGRFLPQVWGETRKTSPGRHL